MHLYVCSFLAHLLVFQLHVMYRIYHPILKFYQMLRVVPRHNPIREIYHNPIRNSYSYRMIPTIPSVIPAYPTSVLVQTSTCKPVQYCRLCASLPVPINLKSSHPPKALYTSISFSRSRHCHHDVLKTSSHCCDNFSHHCIFVPPQLSTLTCILSLLN